MKVKLVNVYISLIGLFTSCKLTTVVETDYELWNTRTVKLFGIIPVLKVLSVFKLDSFPYGTFKVCEVSGPFFKCEV